MTVPGFSIRTWHHNSPSADEADLAPLFTLVLWMTCLVVGVLGLMLPYPWPRAPAKESEPVNAERIKVEITSDPLSPIQAASAPPSGVVELRPPPLTTVAVPSPAIAFAVPIDGLARVVDARQAMPAGPAETTTRVSPPVRHLIYGQGEGQQPAPEYPREAVITRQQGVVLVCFIVGEDGQVLKAEAVLPCPWPLLNQAAVRAVRDNWRFRAGSARSYEVSIQFELKER